jgi:hypothetical protein
MTELILCIPAIVLGTAVTIVCTLSLLGHVGVRLK